MIREADRSGAVFSSIDVAAPPGFLDHGAEYLEGGRRKKPQLNTDPATTPELQSVLAFGRCRSILRSS